MTVPLDVSAGLKPANALDFNNQIGTMLRTFINSKRSVNQWRDWLAGIILTDPPYGFTATEEAVIKSAINDLDAALDAIDMTFINRIAGPF